MYGGPHSVHLAGTMREVLESLGVVVGENKEGTIHLEEDLERVGGFDLKQQRIAQLHQRLEEETWNVVDLAGRQEGDVR